MTDPRREPMTLGDLSALIQGQIDDARAYVDDELATDRRKALEFVRGEVDLQAEDAKSSVTSRDLSDVVGWLMPSLMRQFLGSDRVVLYAPKRRELVPKITKGPNGQLRIEQHDLGKERADQATDFVNYVFLTECNGYGVLSSAFYDGLLLGNGIIKHWFDPTPEYKVETRRGLSDGELAAFLWDVPREDVVGYTARIGQAPLAGPGAGGMLDSGFMGSGEATPPDASGPGPNPGPGMAGAPPQIADGGRNAPVVDGGLSQALLLAPIQQHDVSVRRLVSPGRLCVEALAPEDFLIERNTIKLDETCLGCGHRYRTTRSRLIEMGFDPEIVDDLPTAAMAKTNATALARGDRSYKPNRNSGGDRSTEEVEVFEWYALVDYNGDGIAERIKVLKGDRSGEDGILSVEPWDDDLPFTDVVPDPIPHQWKGKSLFDELYDIQRVKTALLRQTQDNLYQVNNPMNAVLENQVLNMDVLINRELGGNVFVKRPDAVTPLEVPFTADKSFAMLDYWDRVIERRGFSFASGTLDMDALTRQTATGVNAIQQASAVKPEIYARNMAEMGLLRLFRCLLRLIKKHEDKPRTIRLRGKWVDADPTAWDPEMDVEINTGLGSGSRERDAAALAMVAAAQKEILQTLGPNNPLVGLDQYRNTLAKGVEALGLKGPEQYFSEITPEQLAAIANQPPPPDPKMVEAQQRLEIEGMKAQHNAQVEEARAAHEAQLKEAEAAAEHQRKMMQIEADVQAKRDKAAVELQTERDKAAIELRQKREEMLLNVQLKEIELGYEAQLKAKQMEVEARQPQATNIEEAPE